MRKIQAHDDKSRGKVCLKNVFLAVVLNNRNLLKDYDAS